MRLGVVANAPQPSLHLLPSVAERLGYQCGQWLQVEDAERDTQVVRQLIACQPSDGMRPDYIYVDPMSFHYRQNST